MAPPVVSPTVDVLLAVGIPPNFGCLNGGVLFGVLVIHGFHTDISMDRMDAFSSCSWASCFSPICCVHDFLNLLHSPEILYLFLIAFQALRLGYDSLLGIRLILVGCSATRHS